MADVALLASVIQDTGNGYQVPGAQEILIKCITASFDGSGAGGSFIPCLQLIAPNGAVMGTFPTSTTLAAGASADVSWFPRVGGAGATVVTSTQQFAPPLDTPDNGGFTFPGLSTSFGFSNVRRIIPIYNHGGTGFWSGTIRVPANYLSNPSIVVTAATTATSGAVRWIVSTAVVAVGASEDTALTPESAQNVTVPGTALDRFDTTFNLSTVPTPGADLNFRITRDGGNAGDTCTGQVAVWTVAFEYKPSS